MVSCKKILMDLKIETQKLRLENEKKQIELIDLWINEAKEKAATRKAPKK